MNETQNINSRIRLKCKELFEQLLWRFWVELSITKYFCLDVFAKKILWYFFIWLSTLYFKPTLAENGKSLPTLCPVLTSVFKNSCNHTVVKPSKQTKSGLYFRHLISVKNLISNDIFSFLKICSLIFHITVHLLFFSLGSLH